MNNGIATRLDAIEEMLKLLTTHICPNCGDSGKVEREAWVMRNGGEIGQSPYGIPASLEDDWVGFRNVVRCKTCSHVFKDTFRPRDREVHE